MSNGEVSETPEGTDSSQSSGDHTDTDGLEAAAVLEDTEGSGQTGYDGEVSETIEGTDSSQSSDDHTDTDGLEAAAVLEDTEGSGQTGYVGEVSETIERTDSSQSSDDHTDTDGLEAAAVLEDTEGTGQTGYDGEVSETPEAEAMDNVENAEAQEGGELPEAPEGETLDAGVPNFSSQIRGFPHFGGNTNCLPTAENMAGHETTREGQIIVHDDLNTNPDGSVTGNNEFVNDSLDYLRYELENGSRVVIGVNRVEDPSTPNAAYRDYATNHFVTVYRMETNNAGQTTIYFRDPGTAHEGRSLGTLTYNAERNTMEGQAPYSRRDGSHFTYQMTTVRRNIIQ